MKSVLSAVAQRSFELLKVALVSLPVLANPNYLLYFCVYCDSTSVGVGAELAQKSRPKAFVSRILNAADHNYSITEREGFAVILALNEFFFNELNGESCHRSF